MAKRDMKKALGASLKAEEQAVRNRFEQATTAASEQASAPRLQAKPEREQPEPDAARQFIRSNFNVPDGEDELISRIERRCMKAGLSANRREVIRAALLSLHAMPDRELARLFDNSRVKTGKRSPEILTFIIRRADIIKFRGRLRTKPSHSTRKVLIGRRIATIYGGHV